MSAECGVRSGNTELNTKAPRYKGFTKDLVEHGHEFSRSDFQDARRKRAIEQSGSVSFMPTILPVGRLAVPRGGSQGRFRGCSGEGRFYKP